MERPVQIVHAPACAPTDRLRRLRRPARRDHLRHGSATPVRGPWDHAPVVDDLRGKTAVVTGVRGNLGPVWVQALAVAGATVVGLDLPSPASPPDGVERVLEADITDDAGVRRVLGELVDEVVPDILVNNAGLDLPPTRTAGGAAIDRISAEDFRRVVDVNLTGTFTVCAVVGVAMARAGRGSIVNVGSLYASRAPIPELYSHMEPPFLKPPAYGASKAGLVQLTRYLARLWGPDGVRVNVLSPGGIAGGQDPEFVRKFNERVALGRMGDVEDLEGPLLFLASDASRYVTGQELRVDGGFTA